MSSYLHDIDRERVPAHVAIVMDGNGRWAQQRGLPRTEGHGAGEEALWDTVKGANEVGVRGSPSTRSAPRTGSAPPPEVLYLMNFNRGPAAPPARRAERHERADPLDGPPRLARASIGPEGDADLRGTHPRPTPG